MASRLYGRVHEACGFAAEGAVHGHTDGRSVGCLEPDSRDLPLRRQRARRRTSWRRWLDYRWRPPDVGERAPTVSVTEAGERDALNPGRSVATVRSAVAAALAPTVDVRALDMRVPSPASRWSHRPVPRTWTRRRCLLPSRSAWSFLREHRPPASRRLALRRPCTCSARWREMRLHISRAQPPKKPRPREEPASRRYRTSVTRPVVTSPSMLRRQM